MGSFKKTLLISIKPHFFQKILDGHKEIELRRVLPRISSGDIILVYQSSPVKELSAIFEAKNIFSDKPCEIWKTQGNQEGKLGVSKSEFDAYFQGSKKAVCIEFKVLEMLRKPVALSDIRRSWPSFRPPQGFYYLKNNEYEKVSELTGFQLQSFNCKSPQVIQRSLDVEVSSQSQSISLAELS